MSFLDEERTYYDLLEVSPDATPQEIRSAYLRVKAAYRKDSVALYSLMDESETEDLLSHIESAYQVLSNPDSRRDYDKKHGATFTASPAPMAQVVSIDRVPPMESASDDLLVAPVTDFTQPQARTQPSSRPSHFGPGAFSSVFGSEAAGQEKSQEEIFVQTAAPVEGRPVSQPIRESGIRPILPAAFRHPQDAFTDHKLSQEIEAEVEWRGPFLRKVRESRNVPLEELSEHTKISKTYLMAIEEENFPKLPAAVYLRGFLTQVAKYLKLPHSAVVQAYIARFNAAVAEREKQKRSGLR
jgi:curved DNA-binding protein CbpA